MKYQMDFECWWELQFICDQINLLGNTKGTDVPVIQILQGPAGMEVFG